MSTVTALTIVVPIYNAAEHLTRCIDSITANTFRNFELLLINDGSTDNSLEILKEKEMEDSRIKVITKINEGVSKTRNLGIKEATGKFIMFIDNDDYIEKDYIQTFIDNCIKNDADLVIGGYKRVNKSKIMFSDFPRDCDWGKYVILAPWAKIYNRQILIDNNILFLDYPIGEDVYFNLKVFSNTKKIVSIDYIGYNWYFNGNSISNTSQKGFNKDIDILFLLDKLIEAAHGQSDAYLKYFIKRYYVWFLLFSGRQAHRNDFLIEHKRIKKWISDRKFDSTLNPLSNELKGEGIKNRLIVFAFRSLEKSHLIPLFSKFYCKGTIGCKSKQAI
ncbi:glycosyltransferase [Enterococcus casseliflavus]|uniref:glycosyltransferase family 2 protein n=1 Tax=Enterococcus casseliflavus TaxID=37734 RepID=UPI0023DAE70F|nr:glycosyltransferase [Enterococcus casseliflavus]WEL48464.1 glycosyltransferase [Enterococcus casseliflavus]